MIKTKHEIVLFPRTGQKDFIYIDAFNFSWDEKSQNKDKSFGSVTFEISLCVKGSEAYRSIDWSEDKSEGKDVEKNRDVFSEFERVRAVYKLETFEKVFGEITFGNYRSQKNELLIREISINSDKFFGLKVEDFEVI